MYGSTSSYDHSVLPAATQRSKSDLRGRWKPVPLIDVEPPTIFPRGTG